MKLKLLPIAIVLGIIAMNIGPSLYTKYHSTTVHNPVVTKTVVVNTKPFSPPKTIKPSPKVVKDNSLCLTIKNYAKDYGPEAIAQYEKAKNLTKAQINYVTQCLSK